MSTKTSLIKKLRKNKSYREAFVESQISVGIPFQIRSLREQRCWKQGELAERTGMKQPRICAMEQAGYGNFTLNTLRKIASAFDVALIVRFAPFADLVNWADNFTPDTFAVPSSEEDPILNRTSVVSSPSFVDTREAPRTAQEAALQFNDMGSNVLNHGMQSSQSQYGANIEVHAQNQVQLKLAGGARP